MDTGTLISVVAILELEIKKGRDILSDDEYPLSYEEEYAVEFHIRQVQGLMEYFQGAIEANIAGMEMAQGE